MTYKEFKESTEKELNDFTNKYCFWAFGQDQLNKKLEELGLTEEELQKNMFLSTVELCGQIKPQNIEKLQKDTINNYPKI